MTYKCQLYVEIRINPVFSILTNFLTCVIAQNLALENKGFSSPHKRNMTRNMTRNSPSGRMNPLCLIRVTSD